MTFLHSITKDIYITLAENPLISTKYAKIYIKGKFYESKRRKATGLKQTFCHGSRVAKGTKSAIYDFNEHLSKFALFLEGND